MSWRVTNTVNGQDWPGLITDVEKEYWETDPRGKALSFTKVLPTPRATRPEAVKEAPEETPQPKKTRKRTKKQSKSVKPDGDGSNHN